MKKIFRESIMKSFRHIQAIAFDADDTLWDCQSYFERVERAYCQLLAPWGTAEEISARLFETESANMPLLGYGCKAFTLSLIENALKVSRGAVEATVISEIQQLGYSLLKLPATPLPEVVTTLSTLHDECGYLLAVFTKGELLDQENKLCRSGLKPFFDHVEIVSDKSPKAFRALCDHLDIRPSQLLMVGNSFKSDIAPALAVGASAVHIPFHVTWQLEHAEEFNHDRLVRISHFSQLLDCVGDNG